MSQFAILAVAVTLCGSAAIALASYFAFDRLAGRNVRTGPATFRRIALAASVLTLAVVLCSTIVDLVVGPRGPEGLGGVFAVLAAVCWLPVVFAGRHCDAKRPALLYGLLLLLEGAFLGVFLADDVLIFCLCLESSTLLLALLIGGWGGPGSEAIARKFLFYQLTADLLVLIGLLGLVVAAGRMSSETLAGSRHQLSYSLSALVQDVPRMAVDDVGSQEYWRHARRWLMTVLVLGLAIKTPLVPFHTWFAPAVAEGPLCAGLAMLGAGLRVGLYALLRFVGPLCGPLGGWGDLLVAMVVLGAFHESLLALAHGDVRKLTACASLSQASLAVAAFFSQQNDGATGCVLLAVAGGLASTLLLYLCGFLEMQFEARDLSAVSGIWRRLPQVSCGLLLAVFSLVGVPGLCGFTGLFPTLGALFAFEWLAALLAMVGGLIVAWALFWMLERMVFGPPAPATFASATAGAGILFALAGASIEPARYDRAGDLRAAELLLISPLIAGIVLIGIRPQPLLDLIMDSLRLGSLPS